MEAIFLVCGAGGPQLKRNPLGSRLEASITWQFEIKSADSDSHLGLARIDANAFQAELTANGLTASARVEQLGGADGFAEYWRDLAADWRGWTGDRAWESLETELALSAKSDHTGHIHVIVRLQDTAFYHWRVQARLTLEAGQLERIAGNAANFAHLFGAAA